LIANFDKRSQENTKIQKTRVRHDGLSMAGICSVQEEKLSDNADQSIGLRAAQYVRMSTDHQNYSTQNQQATIAKYAQGHGLTVVRTYADEARSGVKIEGRQGLKDLISDVVLGRADFGRILIYDVSRWGRFQDPDEAAHYEFICKEAGVKVEYCAEEFQNDGSVMSAVWKHMKRAYAGEYSRDLSAKTFAGHCRLVELGFRQGGPAGFGLRRLLIDESGRSKGILTRGQRKHLQSDRVILQPGEVSEIELVREVFRQFAAGGKTVTQIARDLNQRGTLNHLGNRWTNKSIRSMLDNENYVGTNIYNRKSFRLGQKVKHNPPDLWIRAPGAFEAIVEPELFAQAHLHGRQRHKFLSDGELLGRLRSLLQTRGQLNRTIIDKDNDVPCHGTYINRFGSLRRAYNLIAYDAEENLRFADSRLFNRSVAAELANGLTRTLGRCVTFDEKTLILVIEGRAPISVCVLHRTLQRGRWPRWVTNHGRRDRKCDLTLIVRMAESDTSILDYFLVPTRELTGSFISVTEIGQKRWDAYRSATREALSFALASIP
jgi:DNA invertase Pin-like site-specific DNA recombinase